MTHPTISSTSSTLRAVRARSVERLTGASWEVIVAVTMGLATLIARAPGIIHTGLFDRDEAFLSVMGGVVGRGGELYVDVIDRKPPIVPYIYAFARDLSLDMRVVRVLCALAIFLNGVVIVAIVRRLTGHRAPALAAGALAVLGTAMFLPADAQAANFELWGLLPASAAILVIVAARTSARTSANTTARAVALHFAAAGALVALAANCKQPYIVVLLPILVEVLRRRVDRVRNLFATGVGLLAATLPLLLLVDAGRMWRWGWADNGDYLAGGVSLTRALAVGAGLTLVFAIFHLPVLYGFWAATVRRVRIDVTVLAWLLASVLVLPIGLRFFGHYYQQVVPPLAVMTGIGLVGASRLTWRLLTMITAVTTAVLVVLAFLLPADLSDFTAIGRHLQATTAPTDRILVWGALPDVYISADRAPAGVFLHGGYLTGNWASRSTVLSPDVIAGEPFRSRWNLFLADLDADPPAVIVDAARPGTDWAAYSPMNYPLGQVLIHCYTREAVIDGLPVWRRNPEGCSR